MTTPGSALSGWFVPPGTPKWCPSASDALTLMHESGFKKVSLPVWYCPNPSYDIASVVSQAHDLELSVHLVGHSDGPSIPYGVTPASNAPEWLKFVRWLLAASGIGAGDSMEWWNELGSDWGPLAALYATEGQQIHQAIKSAKVESVCPLPLSQSAEDAQAFLDGMLSPQLMLDIDSWGAHVYKADLGAELPTVASLCDVLHAVTTITRNPVRVTEYGGTLPKLTTSATSQPDSEFYGAVASWCAENDTWGTSWQWNESGDGLTVSGHPNVLSAIVNATVTGSA